MAGVDYSKVNDHLVRTELWSAELKDVLQEQLVNFHLVLGFGFNLGNSGKEALFIFFAVQLIAKIAEIHLERWIRDDVVKFFQVLAVFVIGVQHGIPLNYIRD